MKPSPAAVGGCVVLIVGALAWANQWRYDELRQGQSIVMMRTNRFTGRTERLSDKGWAVPTPVPTLIPRPSVGPVPAEELSKVETQAKLAGTRLSITAYNGTEWEITELIVDVTYEGDQTGRQYSMPLEHLVFVPGLISGLDPRASGQFSVDLGLDPAGRRVSWRVVGASGIPSK